MIPLKRCMTPWLIHRILKDGQFKRVLVPEGARIVLLDHMVFIDPQERDSFAYHESKSATVIENFLLSWNSYIMYDDLHEQILIKFPRQSDGFKIDANSIFLLPETTQSTSTVRVSDLRRFG